MNWLVARQRITKTGQQFKSLSQYAWLPALLVSSISAYYGYQNNRLQIFGARPELSVEQVTITDPYDQATFRLKMRNVGTRSIINLNMKLVTVDPTTNRMLTLANVASGNTIHRETEFESHGPIDVKQYLGLLTVCVKYRDANDAEYTDALFYKFPGLNPHLTKETGGGGEYVASYIYPDERRILERLPIC
jgi:hypothetical protein